MTFQFENLSDFFAMGGYGFYVWLAYGLSFLAMGVLIWQSMAAPKALFRQIKKTNMRETQRKNFKE